MAESQAPELIPPVPAPEPEGLVVPSETDRLATVVVADAPLPPVGRSWAFDADSEEFVRVGSRGPRAIYGNTTLIQWIEKCLRTERGVNPIHPEGYGVQDPKSIFGRPIRELSVQELQRRFDDALKFHPRIAGVVGVRLRTEDEAAFVALQVQTNPPLDEAELLQIRVPLGVSV